ncbi:MAG: hypothetical protein RMI91_06475 [Gemmatales bacterium]|nr:hypothetical protein [Gemmatales bacterium]MDW7994281.1 hypothetical protein [Gemmatales bacterium]
MYRARVPGQMQRQGILVLQSGRAEPDGGNRMHRSGAIVLAWLALWNIAATYRTPNFVVHAPTPEVAQRVGELAEHYRREKALQWLGYELPPWNVPVPIRVVVLPGSPGGATSYQPIDGQIFDMQMTVQGPLERIYHSVLPHEITHTVLVSHFRCPLPRWADEGSAVLSEDEAERRRHDQLVRQALAQGRAFRLRVLFHLRDYPGNGLDIVTLYAQGYSVVRFLVETWGRAAFLQFLSEGMRRGWDVAVQRVYGCRNIEDLEERWLSWLRGQSPGPTPQWAGPNRIPEMTPPVTSPSRATTAARPAAVPTSELGAPGNALHPSLSGGQSRQAPTEELVVRPSWDALPNVRLLPPIPTTPANEGWVPVPKSSSGETDRPHNRF